MANFNKAFNFRGGFQVDTDVLIVRGQNVGIGSTIPSERLDVNGIIKANGLDIRSTESVNLESAIAGILTVTDVLRVGVETGSALPFPQGSPQVEITTGIITSANPAIGVVTYYGDGGRLLNLPTSQWLDVDVGLGFTSIYAQGYVGVDTTDPRYVFQVGGVPFGPKAGFVTSQTGVGIEDGEIYASGIITTQSSIGAAGTIYSASEFVGVGSNITILNADNIAIGSIGSMRYGDIINTKEVYADRFIGTATDAEDLVPGAQISIDTARANEIYATNRFISTEGGVSIGHSDTTSLGDIDVRKDSGDSTIYSLSDVGNARIFAGTERQSGPNNKFGGLRYGGNVTGSPLSQVDDLDLANYSPGNINFYLHDGSPASGTIGAFRWIYGQLETVPMELSAEGLLELNGNIVSGEPTLKVTGISTFSDEAYFADELTVAGNSNLLGDVVVGGELSFSEISFASTITVPSVEISDQLLIGSDPSVSSGIKLESTGNGELTGTLTAGTNTLGPLGLNILSGIINAPSANITNVTSQLVDSTSVNSTTYSNGGGGFTVDGSGNITGESISVNDITVSGTLNIPGIAVSTSSFDDLNATNLVADNADITNGQIANLTVSSSATFNVPLTVTSANISNITANVITTAGAGDLAFNTSIDLGTNDISCSDINYTGILNGDEAKFTSQIDAPIWQITPDYKLQFNVDESSEELLFTILDSTDTPIGDGSIPYTPSTP